MNDKQEQYRQILDRYKKLEWMPMRDIDWILATLAELLENRQ